MTDIVTLKANCDELKIDPREARERLRAAASDAKANPELAKTEERDMRSSSFERRGESSAGMERGVACSRQCPNGNKAPSCWNGCNVYHPRWCMDHIVDTIA
ncbi:MAG: hypothetical protein JJ859_12105 [Roseicyclus sp.]|nr:hypothetical protein [Roseicyclus sp.]